MENSAKPLFFYGEKTVTRQQGKKEVEINRRVAYAGVLAHDNENIMHIGVSMCSEKDIFTKAKGRAIATGRAFKKPVAMINLANKPNVKPTAQFIEEVKRLIKE